MSTSRAIDRRGYGPLPPGVFVAPFPDPHASDQEAEVSRALRGSPHVRPETRQRILQIARQLNYRVDRNAARLRTGRGGTLALLLFEDPTGDDSQINPFFLSMLGSVTRAAASYSYAVLVSFQQLSDFWDASYEASNRADGIILLGYGDYLTYGEKLDALQEMGSHFIIWGPPAARQLGHSLSSDNFDGAVQAVRHLVRLGRRRIAFLGGAGPDCPEFEQRHLGYCSVLREAGLTPDPTLHVEAINQEGSGSRATQRLLSEGGTFDAIFAASDLIAIGAMRTLHDARVDVPREVSVVGFDDLPAASYVYPGLTTVRQDTALAGKLLVDKLIKIIEGEHVESAKIPLQLVVRESCGAKAADHAP
ncbi:MAG: substrate-binding domain-containing protein [Pseudomonadota bacterium]